MTDWLFGEDSVRDDSKYDLQGDGTLIIPKFDSSNAGLYRCIVENDTGRCISKAAKLLYLNSKLATLLLLTIL